jgi:hypothetical protein
MRRYKVNKRRDKKIFKRTAIKTREINLSSTERRGGTRL